MFLTRSLLNDVLLHAYMDSGLETHMQKYWKEMGFKEMDSESRYFMKEAGAHYVIDNMDLSSKEKEELKRTISARICLEQALKNCIIPSEYLSQALAALPEKIQNIDFIKGLMNLGDAVASLKDDYTSLTPFRLDGEGPYTAVRKKMIRNVVKVALDFTGEPIARILNTSQRTDTFNKGGAEIKQYIDNHPTTMGLERN